MVVLLASIMQWTAASGQTPIHGKSTSEPRHVGLAKMWVNVAKWRWQLTKKNEPMPSFDSTSVEGFRRSLQVADSDGNPAGLYTLYNNVLQKLGRKGYDGVNEEAFVVALEDVLRAKKTISATDTEIIIAKLHSLGTGSTGLKVESPNTAKPQNSKSDDFDESPTQTEVDNDSSQRSDSNEILLKQTLASNESLSLYCKLLGGGIVILAIALAVLASLLWRNARSSGSSANSKKADNSNQRSSSKPSWSDYEENVKLKQDLLAERKRCAEQLKELNELKDHNIQSDKVSSTSPEKVNSTSNTIASQTLSTPQAIQPALTVQFADKPENRYLTRLYPDSEAYRPLLIHFSTDPSVSEARFEFNPAADQFFFTHNGVDQLTGTFTYSPPDWLKNPQTIRTIASGRLRRDETGWLVDKPAQIEIC